MKNVKRLMTYGRRFLLNRTYRNKIFDLLDRATRVDSSNESELGHGGDQRPAFIKGRRLFAVAGCELTFLTEYLESRGMEVFHTESHGRPADPLSEVLQPGSRAMSEPWDVFLLSAAQLFRGLVRKIQILGMTYDKIEQESDLESIINNFRGAMRTIREKSSAPIFLFSYFVTYLPTYGLHEYRSMKKGWSLLEFLRTFQLRLYTLAREFAAVYLLDPEVAFESVGKHLVVDPEQSNGIFDHLSRAGAKHLADHFIHHLYLLEPNRRLIKCAVFDLDGTLWAGVIREDGPGGVSVKEYFLNTMEILASRGVLLALCSKNDPAEGEHLPKLLGKELHSKIVSKQLSWKPKSQAVRDIAEELNIGLNSLAFIDDSPFERAEVSANAPEVLVLTPDQIFRCPNLPEFQPLGEMTAESVSRVRKYEETAARNNAERASETLDGFLVSCELKVELRLAVPADVSRIFELLGRTNQLNATLLRTSMMDLTEQIMNPMDFCLRTAHLSDRFGDYGLIGFASVHKELEAWQVLELAFSCRAMGRGVEQAVLTQIASEALANCANRLFINFLHGPRNKQMYEILTSLGFVDSVGVPAREGVPVQLDLILKEPLKLSFPHWLNVKSDSDYG